MKENELAHESVLERFKLQLDNSNIITKYSLTPDFSWAAFDVNKIINKYLTRKFILILVDLLIRNGLFLVVFLFLTFLINIKKNGPLTMMKSATLFYTKFYMLWEEFFRVHQIFLKDTIQKIIKVVAICCQDMLVKEEEI